MNCFVIMPFADDFDDVYAAIKDSVEAALATNGGQCFRLDEARPAGRITNRLLTELRSAYMCVADLTGNKPNVMWELGYAMALGRPTIIITQSLEDLPFDLKDMQSLVYDRKHLTKSLGDPLKRMVIDTVSAGSWPVPDTTRANASDELVAELRQQVGELKSIVAQAVRFWNPSDTQMQSASVQSPQLKYLEGAWFNRETRSHLYAAMVNDEMVMPYCYAGNQFITGVYYGWRMVGDHWFARFKWLEDDVSGFSFLKQQSLDLLTGAWWMDEDAVPLPAGPPDKSGVQATWERRIGAEFPEWASEFIEEVRQEGLENRFARR